MSFIVLKVSNLDAVNTFLSSLTFGSYLCTKKSEYSRTLCWINKRGTDLYNCPIYLVVEESNDFMPQVNIVVEDIETSVSACKINGGEVLHVVDNKIAFVLGPENLCVCLIELTQESIVSGDTGIQTFVSVYPEYEKLIKNIRNNKSRNEQSTDCVQTPSLNQHSLTNSHNVNENKDAQANSWNPPVGLKIPSIRTSLLHRTCFMPIYPNSTLSCCFENEIFCGKMLLLINSGNVEDKYKHRFEGTKYTYEVQIQGKFNEIPKGRLFMGAEITKKMELGLFTKGLCASILKFGKSVNAYLHHSFGDKDNFELPHITGPLWSAVDRLIITGPGKTPPIMGETFPEDPVSRSIRRKVPDYTISVSLDNIYSFSFKTSNIDLIHWKAANLPLMGSMDLHTFWGDASLRMCAYCVPTEAKVEMNDNGLPKFHPQSINQYCFALEVQHVSNNPDIASVVDHSFETLVFKDQHMDEDDKTIDMSAIDISSDDDFYDADDGNKETVCDSPIGLAVCNDMHSAKYDDSSGLLNHNSKLLYETVDMNKENFVIAAIEVDEIRKSRQGGRRTFYAFALNPENTPDIKECVLHTYSEWTSLFPLHHQSQKPFNYTRMSEVEQRRRELNRSYQHLCLTHNSKYASKLQEFVKYSENDSNLLVKTSKGVHLEKQTDLDDYYVADLALVQLGNHFWSEEYVRLTQDDLIFIKKSAVYKGYKRIHVPLNEIIEVRSLDPRESSIHIKDLDTIVVTTFSKQYVMMLRSTRAKDWLQGFKINLSGTLPHSRWLDLYSRTIGWKYNDGPILNTRNYPIGYSGVFFSHDLTTQLMKKQLPEYVESLLEMAFQLSLAHNKQLSSEYDSEVSCEKVANDNQKLWIQFMDGVSYLQTFRSQSIQVLPIAEKICTLLNLYHCMVIHTSLFNGLPDSEKKWNTFVNNNYYEAFDDIFSLAELEHNIIKSAMSRPNLGVLQKVSSLGGTVAPHKHKYDFELDFADYRLIWAVNCGSKSCLQTVPIYKKDLLEKQLNAVVRNSLAFQIKINDKNIVLPVITQWYSKEIIRNIHEPRKTFSKKALMLRIFLEDKHLREPNEAIIASMISKISLISNQAVFTEKFSFSYDIFEFNCNPIKLQSDDDSYFYEE